MGNIGRVIKVSEFIDTKFREFWDEVNLNKNAFLDYEMLMAIEKRIIWGAYKLGMGRIGVKFKTSQLQGETIKYHIAGDATIQDSIKGLATDWKRQPAVRILKGVGNMGSHAGDPGAAARYTSVTGTPLLSAMIKDLDYVPKIKDETGLEQPKFVSTILPMALINGKSSIGQGRAAYYDERDAREVIKWIDELRTNPHAVIPDPISTTGCKVWKDPKNGYTYYEAIIEKDGNMNVITALPPNSTPKNVMYALKTKLPKRHAERVVDGSGDGQPIYIMVPKNALKEEEFSKFKLRYARKEAPYIWDEEQGTMIMSDHTSIALSWFTKRKEIVRLRLNDQVSKMNNTIHRIDLIKLYVDKEMSKWKVEEIENELGTDDANIVLSTPARSFLPENLKKNELQKKKLKEEIKAIKEKIQNVGDVVIQEAFDIIEEQEKFFASFE